MTLKINQIRLHNLEALIAEAGSAAELARSARTNSSYLSQVRNQLPTPKGTPRSIGDQLADKLEKAMKKPQGWMDFPHRKPAALNMNDEGTGSHGLLPVLSWGQIGHANTPTDTPALTEGTELLPCPVACSPGSYVLNVQGSSMEPTFHEGDLIFIDPLVPASHGKYVVVKLDSLNEGTFRQLVIEEGKQYLKALNPDWPNRITEVRDTTIICGVIIFKGQVL